MMLTREKLESDLIASLEYIVMLIVRIGSRLCRKVLRRDKELADLRKVLVRVQGPVVVVPSIFDHVLNSQDEELFVPEA